MSSTAGELAKTPATSPRGQVLTQQLTVYSAQLAKLQATLSDLRTNPPDPGEVITPAATASTGLGLAVYALAGLVLGLLAAAALAGWLALADDRVHAPADLERAGFAGLGPIVRTGADLPKLFSDPAAPITEDDRSRRITVAVGVPSVPATLLVAGVCDDSALPAAVRLAVSLVRADSSVILVDSARGGLTDLVEEMPSPGLSEVLLRRREALKVLRRPQPRLAVFPGQRHRTGRGRRSAALRAVGAGSWGSLRSTPTMSCCAHEKRPVPTVWRWRTQRPPSSCPRLPAVPGCATCGPRATS